MTVPVLEAEGLTKHFGALHALDDLSLTVDAGEVFGYLGPNGAGKTTTIRLLLDFLRPTAGACRLLGGSGADPAVRARIGYLPGDLHVDPRYTADDLVEFYGALRGGVDRAWVQSLYERFDLDPTRPGGELSTGNRRKVGIVQAFMHRPELLLLDEPTSGLDPLLQQEFRVLVREEVARGASVFLSSHVLPEVEVLAERVGVLRRGQLIAVAGVHDLRREARQRIELHVVGPVDPQLFASLPEVVEVTTSGDVVHLVVQGSVDRVVKAAAQLEVHRIVTHDEELEDAFLSYFKDGDR